jgi:hypothetical protein
LSAACGKGAGIADRRNSAAADDGGANDHGATDSGALPDGGLSGSAADGALPEAATCLGAQTTISGVVMDPAGVNPLFGVDVYIPTPGVPLPDLTNIPIYCGGCGAFLFPASVQVAASSDTTGAYQLQNVPSGLVSIVVQSGRWRRRYDSVPIQPCAANVVDLRLPASSAEGDLPDIAISTGGGDSLECLPLRFGVAASEYSGPGSHVHIFAGANGANTAPPSPASSAALWDSASDLEQHDVLLLSCEGAATFGVTPQAQQALIDYSSRGGQVFATHQQSAWFATGPLASVADWTDGGTLEPGYPGPVLADVDTTLPTGAAFPEAQQLGAALGGVPPATLPLWFANDSVQATHPVAVEWVHVDPVSPFTAGATQVFSVDMPLGVTLEALCARMTFFDFHVAGTGATSGLASDYAGAGADSGAPRIVPDGCAVRPLSAQERLFELLFFHQLPCLVPGAPRGSGLPLPP